MRPTEKALPADGRSWGMPAAKQGTVEWSQEAFVNPHRPVTGKENRAQVVLRSVDDAPVGSLCPQY